MAATVPQQQQPIDGHLKAPEAAVHLEKISFEPQIRAAHREYLSIRNRTLELRPLPSACPDDPLNWPTWKKNTQNLMVAFHAMMTTSTAAGIIPGFVDFAKQYETFVPEAS